MNSHLNMGSIKSVARKAMAQVQKLFANKPPSPVNACVNKAARKGAVYGPPLPPKAANALTFKSPDAYLDKYAKHNAELLSKAQRLVPADGKFGAEVKEFSDFYRKNKARYETVSQKTGFPPDFIAAVYWREHPRDFNGMMSNGASLNKKSTIAPYDGPYSSWEESALAALGNSSRQAQLKKAGLDKDPNDLAALATLAEKWNGVGYSNKGLPSPYLFSGTDVYSKGKYVADGVYDPNTVDKQIGVVPLLVAVRGTPEKR
jgi:lysozyme family protein